MNDVATVEVLCKIAVDLMRLGKEVLSFDLSDEDRREGRKLGLSL